MGHDAVIAALKALSKVELLSIPMKVHIDHLKTENDRVCIILAASMIEESLFHAITGTMKGELSTQERQRIFQFEGPIGSFSSRIRIAQALGIIDKQTRLMIETIKEMRNAAAHSHLPITFTTQAIREATASLAEEKHSSRIIDRPPLGGPGLVLVDCDLRRHCRR